MENESKMAGENSKHVISQLIRMYLTRSVFDIAVDRLLVTFYYVSRFGGESLKQNWSRILSAVIRIIRIVLWQGQTKLSTFAQLNTVNTRQPPCLFFFVPSTKNFRAKAVYMVLGSSWLTARKILALGPSTTPCM